jgi:MFS family permease
VRSRVRAVDPALLAIVAEGFLSRLSFGLISFALPLYAYQEFGLSIAEIGLLASFNLAVAIALKPFMGSLADRVGMKPSFTVAIGLRSVVSFLLAFATLPWQLFAIRGVHGVSISLRDPSANVLLAELGGKKAVASAFAWYQTAKSVAGAIGKASAGVLLALTAANFTAVFLIAFALSALPVLVVGRYVREPAEDVTAPAAGEPVAAELAPAPSALPFAGLGFLISGTAYMLANLFPLFAVEYAGLSEAQTGAIYLISIVVVLSGPVFGWLSDNVSRRLVLSLRGAANVLSSVIYLVTPNFAGVAVGRAVDDAGKAAFRPAWGALMAHVAGYDRRRRARTMGSLSAGEDAGEVAGPIAAGLIWSVWGVPALLGVRIGLAVVTEIYARSLTRFLDRLDGVGRPPAAGPGEKGDGVFTAEGLVRHTLKSRLGAYDREAVDDLLGDVAADYGRIWRERYALRGRVEELEAEISRYRADERVLQETLVTSRRVADAMTTEAHREAEAVLEEARKSAGEILRRAERERDHVAAEVRRLRQVEHDAHRRARGMFLAALEALKGGAGTPGRQHARDDGNRG